MKLLVIKLALVGYLGVRLSSVWAQDHFQFVGPTAESYSIVVTSAVIDGDTLEVGDEIGVFISAGLCVGATKLPPLTNIQLAAWKDDPQTTQIVDGYMPGDTMRFKIWDSSAKLELSAKAVYQMGNGTFEDGLYAILALSATSNQPPVISLPGPMQFPEDDSLLVSLVNAATDSNDPPDSLSWRTESGPNIHARVNQSTKVLTLASRQNDWNGQDTLRLTVEDPHSATDDAIFVVTVLPVNDPPSLNLPASVTFNEDNTQILALDSYMTDMDNSAAEMKWAISSPDTTTLNVRYDAMKREARLVPAPNWNGRIVLSVTVEDASKAAVSGALPVVVLPANDPPSIPQLLAPADNQTSTILKWNKAIDPDSGDAVRYLVQIAADSSFSQGSISREIATEELAISAVSSQLTAGKIYYWQVKAMDQQNASSGFSRKWSFKYEGGDIITDVENGLSINLPVEFMLHQSYPNPVSQREHTMIMIRVDLPKAGHISLQIFNLLGQSVRRLIDAEMSPGYHQIFWDGKDEAGNRISDGLYFYRLKTANVNLVKKLVVVK